MGKKKKVVESEVVTEEQPLEESHPNEEESVKTYVGESPYGSHKSMVVRELGDGHVVLKDELGEYITHKIYLDNGKADPNRFNATRHP